MMAFLENDEQVFHLSPVFSKIDNSATPIACEFLQTPPVGDFSFEVCVVADVLNETVCESIAGVTWGTESKITERDCAGDSPSGYCETPIGDIYYYTDEDFSTGCTFMNGVWHEL